MPPVNPYQGARTRVGTLTFPFSDEWVDFFRQDGKYYTNHPLLRGPYDGAQDVHRAVSRLLRNRSRQQALKKHRPQSVRRWVRRALRGASPGVTKDLQPPATPSDKLVAAITESASALTLQHADVSSLVESVDTTSLEESITASPRTVPHNTIGSSLSSCPFSCEKCVATSAESSCAERDVSSSEELLDPTSTEEPLIAIPGILPHKAVDSSSSSFPFSCEKIVACVTESTLARTLQESGVPSLDEFLDSTSSEELIPNSPQAELHDPIDGSSSTFPFRCEKLVAGAIDSASMLSEGSTTASPQSVLDNITDGSPSSASSLGSQILIRRPWNWYQVFYIRMDLGGSFWIYPNLGGPFQSVDEADGAIGRYLDELWHRSTCKEPAKLPRVERLIHERKYYLDGTPKRGPNSPKEDEKIYLMQALLHKYNEDHNLFGNHALELEELLGQQLISENHRWYYHFNFTIKQNEGSDNSRTSNLFFAEVSHMQGEKAWEVNCCCMIKHDENGHCYGCRNNGSPDMKHPDNIGAYTGGHKDGYLPFGLEESSSSDDEEAEEEKLRAMFKGHEDPKVFGRLFSLTKKKILVSRQPA